MILAHQERLPEGTLEEFVAIAAEGGLCTSTLHVDRSLGDGYPPVPVAILELHIKADVTRVTKI